MNKEQCIAEFKKVYGYDEAVRVFKAPARINLIGEHIDYNGGTVMPAALSMYTWVVVGKRADNILRVAAQTLPGIIVQAPYSLLQYMKGEGYGAYQFGVADEMLKAGFKICGADMLFWGEIPFHCGLSSSASNEVVTAYALASLIEAPKDISLPKLAQICMRAENTFVGVQCGIMDQMAAACGKEANALLLNCQTLRFDYVPFIQDDYVFIISNTNKPNRMVNKIYRERQLECQEALAELRTAYPNLAYLCDLTPEQFHKHASWIERGRIYKRARHVVEEQHRVKVAMEALKYHDLETFGKLLTASHISLRELYEVTGTSLDVLNYAALQAEGVLGSRMMGEGFGGCILTLIHKNYVDSFQTQVSKRYYDETGYVPSFYPCQLANGVHEVTAL